MTAGKRDQRLALYQAIPGKTALGTPSQRARLRAKPWAKVEHLASADLADRQGAVTRYRITMLPQVPAVIGDWIEWRGRWLKVTDVDPHPRQHRVLEAEHHHSVTPPEITA